MQRLPEPSLLKDTVTKEYLNQLIKTLRLNFEEALTASELSDNEVFFEGDYTGATDEVANLENFIYLNSTLGSVGYNRVIRLREGTLKFSRPLNPPEGTSVLLRGAGRFATTIIYQNVSGGAIYTTNQMLYQRNNTTQVAVTSITSGAFDDGYSYTTNCDIVSILNVADSSAFADFYGKRIALHSSDLHPAGDNIRMGEAPKVIGVGTGKIYLAGKLKINPTLYYTTNIYANTMLDDNKFEISDIGFMADETTAGYAWDDISHDGPSSGANAHCVTVQGYPNAIVRDCYFNKLWEGAVYFDNCPDAKAYNNLTQNLVDTGSPSGTSLRLGYHYAVANNCNGTVIENNMGSEGRHYVTSSHHSVSSYAASKWYQCGCSVDVTIRNNLAVGTYGIPWDEHEAAVYWEFDNNISYWSGRGPRAASYIGYDFQHRGSYTTIKNHTQVGGQYGARVSIVERLVGSTLKFYNWSVSNLYSTTDTIPIATASTLNGASQRNAAFVIYDHSAITNTPTIEIDGFTTDNCNQSIVALGGDIDITATRCNFKRGGVPVECMAGTRITFTGDNTFDFRDTTRTPLNLNCVHLWSLKGLTKAVGAGAEVLFFKKPQILKNSGAKPVAIFRESDTSATKYYYTPDDGFIEYNSDSVNATILLSTNRTTLSKSTKITDTGLPLEHIRIECIDETTPVTATAGVKKIRMPYAFDLMEIPRLSASTAPTGVTLLNVDINENGNSILSTTLTLDAGEKTSTTAAIPAVLSDTHLSNDAEISIDFDAVGSVIAGAGVKVTLIGRRGYDLFTSLLLEDNIASSVIDLDATYTDSYGGAGQTWANLVTSPADGSAQTAYDFYLGATSSTTTDDPTFTGSAGTTGAYFALDGGDYFKIKSGVNTTFLNSLGKDTSTQDFWIAIGFRAIDSVAAEILCATSTGTTTRGIDMVYGSTERISFRQHGDSALVTSSTGSHSAVVPGSDYIYIMSYSDGLMRSWLNSASGVSEAFVFDPTSTDPAGALAICARPTGGSKMESGTRIRSFAIGNGFLDDSDAFDMLSIYGERHNIAYI